MRAGYSMHDPLRKCSTATPSPASSTVPARSANCNNSTPTSSSPPTSTPKPNPPSSPFLPLPPPRPPTPPPSPPSTAPSAPTPIPTPPPRDHFTFLLHSCSRRPHPTTPTSLHSHILKLVFHSDLFINNALISLYSASGLLTCARTVFDLMPQRDTVSRNSILTAYIRCGELDTALTLFNQTTERNVRTWNSIISSLVRAGQCKEATKMFRGLLALGDGSVLPDKVTVASVISACASLGALDQGRWVHEYLRRCALEFDVVIGTALVDMYRKCGCAERVVEVFNEMPRRDILAWTAIISALAIHGLGEAAFVLLKEMEKQGMKPNNVTFDALLSACTHSGMVDRGWWCFDAMRRVYSIEAQLQHYACMVSLLGWAGLFGEAERFIASMPMEPDLFVWGALLGACRMHGNVEVGERVAGYLIGLDPYNHAYYIVLSNIHANARRFEDVKRVRAFMKEYEIKKTSPGCSMIEVDGEVHEFSVKRNPKELMKEIRWVLTGINDVLKSAGYFSHEIMDHWKSIHVSEVDI